MKDTAVIMVTWGRAELLKTTLTSYFATINPDRATLIVIDNGSQQATIDVLNEYRSRIDSLVLLNRNMGKPHALNIGVDIALSDCKALDKHLPEYLLFCDSDIFFNKNWLPIMTTSYDEHRTLSNDRPLGGLSGYVHNPHQLTLHVGKQTTVNEIKFCAGCCLMMSYAVFQKNGPWDTKRLIRTVDTRYLRNLVRRGYMNAAVHPSSVIRHIGNKERTWHIANGKPKYRP